MQAKWGDLLNSKGIHTATLELGTYGMVKLAAQCRTPSDGHMLARYTNARPRYSNTFKIASNSELPRFVPKKVKFRYK